MLSKSPHVIKMTDVYVFFSSSFINKFVGKKGGEFVVNKDNSKGLPNEIDAISGATITTRAVTQGVNAAYIVLVNIEGGDINE